MNAVHRAASPLAGAVLFLAALTLGCPQPVNEKGGRPAPPNPRAEGVRKGESGHCFRLREQARGWARAADKEDATRADLVERALSRAARMASEGLGACSAEQLKKLREAKNRLVKRSLGEARLAPSILDEDAVDPAPALPAPEPLTLPALEGAEAKSAVRQLFRQTAEVLIAGGAAATLSPDEYLERKRALEDQWPVVAQAGHEQVEALVGVSRATEPLERINKTPEAQGLLDERRRAWVGWLLEHAQPALLRTAGLSAEAEKLAALAPEVRKGDNGLRKVAAAAAELGGALEGSWHAPAAQRQVQQMLRETMSFLRALATEGPASPNADRLAAGVLVATARTWALRFGPLPARKLVDTLLHPAQDDAVRLARQIVPGAPTVSETLTRGRKESALLVALRRILLNNHPDLAPRLDESKLDGTWGADPLVLAEAQSMGLLRMLGPLFEATGEGGLAGQLTRFASAPRPDPETLPAVLASAEAVRKANPRSAKEPVARLRGQLADVAVRTLQRIDPRHQGERFSWEARDLAGQALFYRTPWQTSGKPGLLVDWKGDEALLHHWPFKPDDALRKALGADKVASLEKGWMDDEVALYDELCRRAREASSTPPRHLRIYPFQEPQAQGFVTQGLHPFMARLLNLASSRTPVDHKLKERIHLTTHQDDAADHRLLFAAADIATKAVEPLAPDVRDAASAEAALVALEQLPVLATDLKARDARRRAAAILALARRWAQRPVRTTEHLDLRPFLEVQTLASQIPGAYDRARPRLFVNRLLENARP